VSPDTDPPAVVARDVSKLYRRFLHKHQFKTLKSALVTGSLLSDLKPDQTFTALEGVSFEVPEGTVGNRIEYRGSPSGPSARESPPATSRSAVARS